MEPPSEMTECTIDTLDGQVAIVTEFITTEIGKCSTTMGDRQ